MKVLVHIVENKTAKNIGLLHHAKPLLNEAALNITYFSYIHAYLIFANIAWATTSIRKLKKLHLLRKRAVRITFNEDQLLYVTNALFYKNGML